MSRVTRCCSWLQPCSWRREPTIPSFTSGSEMTPRARLLEHARRRPSQVFRKAASSPRARSSARPADMALIAVFLVLISLPLSGLIFGFDRSFVLEENRDLATRPELKLERPVLARFLAGFEAYFNDRFGFRKRLIYWLALVKVKGLGVTSTPGVTLGRNGWLYLASEAALSSYRATRPFTPEQLEKYRAILEARRDWLAARKIPYLLVIPPNKDTIYPEFVPDAYTKVNARSRLDQLVDYMRSRSKVTVLDVRDDLRRARQVEQVFDVTDSHWNPRGGYVAYERIMQALSAWFPGASPMARADFREVTQNDSGGDLARMLGVADRTSRTARCSSACPDTAGISAHTDEECFRSLRAAPRAHARYRACGCRGSSRLSSSATHSPPSSFPSWPNTSSACSASGTATSTARSSSTSVRAL